MSSSLTYTTFLCPPPHPTYNKIHCYLIRTLKENFTQLTCATPVQKSIFLLFSAESIFFLHCFNIFPVLFSKYHSNTDHYKIASLKIIYIHYCFIQIGHYCNVAHCQILSDRTFFKTSIYPLPIAYGHSNVCQHINF